jgi:hypothetical protein
MPDDAAIEKAQLLQALGMSGPRFKVKPACQLKTCRSVHSGGVCVHFLQALGVYKTSSAALQ